MQHRNYLKIVYFYALKGENMLKIKRFLKYKRCISCGQEFLDFETRKINRTDYICADCLRASEYSTRNFKFEGKEKSISFSFEYETSIKAKSTFFS